MYLVGGYLFIYREGEMVVQVRQEPHSYGHAPTNDGNPHHPSPRFYMFPLG